MRSIDVYDNDEFAGTLTEVSATDYRFRYADSYLSNGSPYGISATLPKSKEEYRSEAIFPFFTNMLPEGSNRKILCRLFKVDEDDFFGMLMAVRGADFIGAINLR